MQENGNIVKGKAFPCAAHGCGTPFRAGTPRNAPASDQVVFAECGYLVIRELEAV